MDCSSKSIFKRDLEHAADESQFYLMESIPDLSHIDFSAEAVFGTDSLAQTAREEAESEVRREWAKQGMENVKSHLLKLVRERHAKAFHLIRDELPTVFDDIGGLEGPDVPSKEECLRQWWVLNFQIGALLDLLPSNEVPTEIQSLTLPDPFQDQSREKWTAREPTTRRAVELLNEYCRSTDTIEQMSDLGDLLRECGHDKARSKRNSIARALRESGAEYEEANPRDFVRALAQTLHEVEELPQHLATLRNTVVDTDE